MKLFQNSLRQSALEKHWHRPWGDEEAKSHDGEYTTSV